MVEGVEVYILATRHIYDKKQKGNLTLYIMAWGVAEYIYLDFAKLTRSEREIQLGFHV